MKGQIKNFFKNYGQLLCAFLCPLMSFVGTYYASKSAINEVYITEKYNISKIFFDRKIKEYENFYSLASQEINLSNFTDNKIYIYINTIKDTYAKMKNSSFVLFSFCENDEIFIVEEIVACYEKIYILFLNAEKELSHAKKNDEAIEVKKKLISNYIEHLNTIKSKLNILKLVMRRSVSRFKNAEL